MSERWNWEYERSLSDAEGHTVVKDGSGSQPLEEERLEEGHVHSLHISKGPPMKPFAQRRTRHLAGASAPDLNADSAGDTKQGQRMEPLLRQRLETFFGTDLAEVRIHVGSQAASLGAQAFAFGSDLYFMPGHYEPCGREGLRLLVHELTHVLQQRTGRVASRRGQELALVEEPLLEAEADRVAEDFLLGRRGPGWSTSALHPGSERARVIQRSVGIEYETALQARYLQTYDRECPHLGWIKQDEKMWISNGWNIDADNSKLEFVTYPPVEIEALGGVVEHMLGALQSFKARIKAAQSSALELPQPPTLRELLIGFGRLTTEEDYVVLPYKEKYIRGVPQATLGIPFPKLFGFFRLLCRHEFSASKALIEQHGNILGVYAERLVLQEQQQQQAPSLRPTLDKYRLNLLKEHEAGCLALSQMTAMMFENITASVLECTQPVDNLEAEELDKLRGLLHLVVQYAKSAIAHGTSYKKRAFAVMTRTSFRSLYEALSFDAQEQFIKRVRRLLEQSGVEMKNVAFPEHKGTNFTIRQWLESIVKPVDVLLPTENPYEPEVIQSDLMTAPGAFSPDILSGWQTDKSMGSMGLDGDKVVVELRTLHHFTQLGGFTPMQLPLLVNDLKALLESLE